MNNIQYKIVQKILAVEGVKQALPEDEFNVLLFSHPAPSGIRALGLMTGGGVFNALDLRRAYNEEFGESYDWHEFSNLLDAARRHGLIKFVRTSGGLTNYKMEVNK